MALEIFATIKGEKQGDITGDASGSYGGVDVADMNRITHFTNEVELGGDRASGRATGRRVHAPIKVKMPVQSSMPMLYQACVDNEQVECNFKMFHPNVSGQTEHLVTVAITGGRVAHVGMELPSTLNAETASLPPMLEVWFTYNEITWTHETASREAHDDWSAGDNQ